jgi:hypothetical protein
MQPDNEKITQIIDTASESLMRQVLPEIIAAGATPDQVAHASRAIAIFKQAITGEMPFGLVANAVGRVSLSEAEDESEEELEEIQAQYMELAQEYEEQSQVWDKMAQQQQAEIQALQAQLEAALAPRNGHVSKQQEEEDDDEVTSAREAVRSRLRSARRRSSGAGFGARGR